MEKDQIKKLIAAHVATLEIEIPDAEVLRVCQPAIDKINARLDAIEAAQAPSKIVRIDMLRASKLLADRRGDLERRNERKSA